MNIDHIGFNVSDFKKSREFYVAALAALGLKIIGEGEGWAMMGTEKCDFVFGQGDEIAKKLHLAFVADTHEKVQQFYEAAMKHGAKDNGAPGLCPEYSPTYYAAFVIDPNGHNLEAVCR